MIRAFIIAACLSAASPALAMGDAHFWPTYVETESLATLPPMGAMIRDTFETAPAQAVADLIESPTDANLEAFDETYGDGAAAAVMSGQVK